VEAGAACLGSAAVEEATAAAVATRHRAERWQVERKCEAAKGEEVVVAAASLLRVHLLLPGRSSMLCCSSPPPCRRCRGRGALGMGAVGAGSS